MWRLIKALLFVVVAAVLIAAGAFGWVWLQAEQVSKLQRAGKYAEAIPYAERTVWIFEKALGPDHPVVGEALNNLAILYGAQRRYTEAEALAKRVLAIFEEELPEDHRRIALSMQRLAWLYHVQGRLGEAEPLYKRALEVGEKAMPEASLDIARNLYNLALLYATQGRFVEAEPLYKRSLAMREEALPEGHPDIALILNNLGWLSARQGRLGEAEPLILRALAMREKALPEGHPDIAQSLNNLGWLYVTQGRLGEAEPLIKRSHSLREKALPEGHPDIAHSLNDLGEVYRLQGRLNEAEPLFKRALAIREKILPQGHADTSQSVNNLALLYQTQGRVSEAEPLVKQALAMRENALPEGHTDIARGLNNLALYYSGQGRFSEAEPLFVRALAIFEKGLPEGHPDIAENLNNLALLYQARGRLGEAESLFKRALAIFEKTLPEGHFSIAHGLNSLGFLYQGQGRFGEAEQLYQRALVMRENSLPDGHPAIAVSLSTLASLYFVQGRLADAESLTRRALAILEKTLPENHREIASSHGGLSAIAIAREDWPTALSEVGRATAILRGREAQIARGRTPAAEGEVKQNANYFRLFILAAYRQDIQQASLREESFEMAQWAERTAAGGALSQMAARQARGEGALGELVRELQDLESQMAAADARLVAALGRGDAPQAGEIRQQYPVLEARWKGINQQLEGDFSEYVALANPKPLSIVDTQARLRDDEALLMFLGTLELPGIPGESFAWAVTKSDARWVKLALPPKVIAEEVAALRCGLDDTLWNGSESEDKCVELVKAHRFDGVGFVGALPFDLERARALYKALIGPLEDLVKDKHLLIVPSGPLTSLPFGVLVTEPPKTRIPSSPAGYRDVAWLGTRQPISVLPSVASLKALREHAKSSNAGRPYLGIGNPLLDGPPDDDDSSKQSKIARAWQQCSLAPDQLQVATSARGRRSIPGLRSIIPGTQANIEYVRRQTPLPETADELCRIARGLGVPESEILLGTHATEATVKDLSEKGRLGDYRVVHFATHGALAGEVKGLSEPGLILTPPPSGTSDTKLLERDDGYLTASEIATLKLDADWVILSACNTAGATGENAEALSGLARAFFYAGARTLLVSHWAVDSDAAVKLTTRAFQDLKANPGIGRAEAFRLSMRELIHNGSLNDAHPMQWAPFVVVGEGAR